MSLAFLEYEENVGRLWHRLAGDRASYLAFPDAAVRLDDERRRLAVFFRGLGGDPGLAFGGSSARARNHRLKVLQRLGLAEERLSPAVRTGELVLLPPVLACLPERSGNRDLYTWLVAFLALAAAPERVEADPLRRDILALRAVRRTTALVLERFPGLAPLHARLAASLLAGRPRRRLPKAEASIEAVVRALHGGGDDPAASVLDREPLPSAPRGYRPFLPAPLWGETDLAAVPERAGHDDGAAADAKTAEDEEGLHRHAERMKEDRSDRNALTLINKGELLLAAAEMVDISRPDDEEDPDAARKAAQDQDTLHLGRPDRKSSSRVKMDLDLGAGVAVRESPGGEGVRYPEWDWRRGAYRQGYCVVNTGASPEAGPETEDWRPDADALRRIRQVRRQFEALRPKREVLRRQADGDGLDVDAILRARTDLAATGWADDRVYLATRNLGRDFCVVLLVDVSLSSDAWIEGRRVLDVEKEALSALAHGLDGCGDPFSILTFTSRRHDDVRVLTVKDFDEPLGEPVRRRIAALRPGQYTRMGAALRHAAALLEARPERHRLLLLLSDGKPNDADHYEGRFGVEDSRKAVQEARGKGLAVFAVTVDKKAETWVPFIFGRGGASIVAHLGRLPEALPRIYRQVTGA
ncbi:MAG: VWA domain-containing protein [Geminicoccaceae bacterium]|nr:VWA domain-containing protein [Geminicoccaceae bacterium]